MFIGTCMASVTLTITVINESDLLIVPYCPAEQLFNSFNIKQFNSLKYSSLIG